jgi:hypothetical protein
VDLLMVEEEKFFAWLDGELEPEEAARVETEVAASPELSRKAEEHRAMTAGLRSAFAPVTAAPVPERVAAAVRQDNVVRLDQARAAREQRKTPIWTQLAALAATLAVGIFMGNMLIPGPAGPIQAKDGRLVAGGELEAALYAQLASAPVKPGPRIGTTYRDKSGEICRTFAQDNASGLACRQGGDWRIRGLFQEPEGQSSDYRMAASADPRLMDLVDESIAGEPFDAAQEKQAKEMGW